MFVSLMHWTEIKMVSLYVNRRKREYVHMVRKEGSPDKPNGHVCKATRERERERERERGTKRVCVCNLN